MEARVKILLVDDNPTIRKLLARSLEKAGDLVIASDGADALMKAIEEKPDLIISDYSMPVMDGRALLGKLREREETKAIPFVFLASQKEIDEQLRMLVEGVEDYFVKPFFRFRVVPGGPAHCRPASAGEDQPDGRSRRRHLRPFV